jgi:hypothetical protein
MWTDPHCQTFMAEYFPYYRDYQLTPFLGTSLGREMTIDIMKERASMVSKVVSVLRPPWLRPWVLF